MTPYGNHAGNSGVAAYELRDDGIAVRFRGGDTYLYTAESAGARNIARMRTLAIAGRGLATFINKYVSERFDRQWG